MSSASDDKNHNSAETFRTPPGPDRPIDNPPPLEFAQAGRMLLETLQAATDELKAEPDLGTWTCRHPWIAVAAAAATGLSAAGILRKEQHEVLPSPLAKAIDTLFTDADPADQPAEQGARPQEPPSAVVGSLVQSFGSRLGAFLQASFVRKAGSEPNGKADPDGQ